MSLRRSLSHWCVHLAVQLASPQTARSKSSAHSCSVKNSHENSRSEGPQYPAGFWRRSIRITHARCFGPPRALATNPWFLARRRVALITRRSVSSCLCRGDQRTGWEVQENSSVVYVENLTLHIANTDDNDLSDAVTMGHQIKNAAIIRNNEHDVGAMVLVSEKSRVDPDFIRAAGASNALSYASSSRAKRKQAESCGHYYRMPWLNFSCLHRSQS
jgi:hypothetical protein